MHLVRSTSADAVPPPVGSDFLNSAQLVHSHLELVRAATNSSRLSVSKHLLSTHYVLAHSTVGARDTTINGTFVADVLVSGQEKVNEICKAVSSRE